MLFDPGCGCCGESCGPCGSAPSGNLKLTWTSWNRNNGGTSGSGVTTLSRVDGATPTWKGDAFYVPGFTPTSYRQVVSFACSPPGHPQISSLWQPTGAPSWTPCPTSNFDLVSYQCSPFKYVFKDHNGVAGYEPGCGSLIDLTVEEA